MDLVVLGVFQAPRMVSVWFWGFSKRRAYFDFLRSGAKGAPHNRMLEPSTLNPKPCASGFVL